MPDQEVERAGLWADRFLEHQERLLCLAARNLNPVLSRRYSPEDVVQDTLAAACKRVEFFENQPEIPVYFKLRIILLQTVADIERKHLKSKKRDAHREVAVAGAGDGGGDSDNRSAAQLHWEHFADTITSPLSRLVRAERHELLREAMNSLSESDRQLLMLRHFDGLANAECAEVLGIKPKAASIRYVRAMERLKNILTALTEFRP